jgi:uncharacterized membrane protein required for colicin V production
MGLDLVLAAVVLIAALRGWLKGFVLQAVRLGGMVACVYEAGPVRDLVRPHVTEFLKGIRPELLDRMLWWAAAVVSYLVTVGLATLLVRAYRRRPYGEPDLYRGDQAAGLLLGAAKGALIVVFMVSALEKHALSHLKGLAWAEQQAQTSHALVWNDKYHPADRIWSAQPVQVLVSHVQKEGLNPPPGEAGADPLRTASRQTDHDLPNEIPSPSKALEDLKAAVDAIDQDVSKRESHNWR